MLALIPFQDMQLCYTGFSLLSTYYVLEFYNVNKLIDDNVRVTGQCRSSTIEEVMEIERSDIVFIEQYDLSIFTKLFSFVTCKILQMVLRI